jgi:beta-glucosidase
MDFHTRHHVTKTAPESAALALKNGCDVNCGSVYLHLLTAVDEGLVTEDDIAMAAERLMATRIKLGMFDESCVYDDIPYEENDSREHRAKSLEAARKSMVLLKNNGVLPLDKTKLASVAVIGPNADSQLMLKGNYFGTPSESVTILEGIREAVGEDVRVYYSEGCHLFQDKVEPLAQKKDRMDEAVSVAKRADVAILCLGMDSNIEGEEGDAGNAAAAGDKADLNLPGLQQELLEKVVATGTPVILILGVGSALAIGYAQEHCAAILNAWYPGSLGGRAAADILFGKCSPGGKLPVTFYRDTAALPAFTDYAMKNRTYRYFEGETLYPFGYGLTYSSVTADGLSIEGSGKADEAIKVSLTLTNQGSVDVEEVAQCYIKPEGSALAPRNPSLCAFRRVALKAGESVTVQLEVSPAALTVVDEQGDRILDSETFTLYAGISQPDARSIELLGQAPLSGSYKLEN